MQIKFNYTDGGEFSLPNGKDFIGYFNVDDSENIYSGRYYNSSSILLESVSKYSSDYYKTNLFKDRFVFDKLTLPYSLEEVMIQPNEIVCFNVLNTKVKYLHENLIYMYSKMFMGATDVPVDDNINMLCSLQGSNTLNWEYKKDNPFVFKFSNLSSVPALNKYSEFDKLNKFVVIPFLDKSGVSIMGVSDTHLIALTSVLTPDGGLHSPSITLYTNIIDNHSQQECKNLEDVKFDGRYLYISDSKINDGGQIFKYDITQYYTNDDIYNGERYLIEPMGGLGGPERKTKFNGCSILGTKPNELWVYDSGNNVIKIYDNNFVWKRTLKIPDTSTYKILDIKHRKMNNHMYVLYQRETERNNATIIKYGMFEYNESFKLVGTYEFQDVLYEDTDKRMNRFAISEQDSNVFYVITDSSIFKKFFTKPEESFAVFNRSKFYPDDVFSLHTKDICIIPSDNNKDDLYFMGVSFIGHVNERTDYITVLREIELPYYNYNRIKFQGNEYNQAFVYNKEIYKLFANIIQFKNTLKGKFYAEYNEYSDLLYKDYIYLSDEEINTLNIELEYNTFINENELIQPNVINRLFNKIYQFQQNLLSLTNVKLKNLKTYVEKNNSNIYPIL